MECRSCGRLLAQSAKGRRRRYCSPACKQKHYRKRRAKRRYL